MSSEDPHTRQTYTIIRSSSFFFSHIYIRTQIPFRKDILFDSSVWVETHQHVLGHG